MCPIDIEKGAWHDMTCKRLQRLILTWVRGRRLWLIHLGTPCTRWSAARTTGVVEPDGGLECALFTVRLLRACRQAGVLFTLENPRASALWKWAPLTAELRRSAALNVNFPQCQYGTPYKKPATLAASSHAFDTLTRTCKCTEHRERLQGLVHVGGKWRWKTSFASAYPPRLARSYAAVAESLAPRSAHRDHGARKLDPRWEEALAGAWHCGKDKAILGAEARVVICERGPPLCPSRYVLPWRHARRRWGD